MFNPYAFAVGLASAWRSSWKGPYSLKEAAFDKLWGERGSSTGIPVSEQTALTYSAFWACVNAISTDVASLPLNLYQRLPTGGKQRYVASKLFRLLHDEPNPEMTSFTMRQTLTAHALSWGGGFAEIEWDLSNRPLAIWPLTPDRVTVGRNSISKAIEYSVSKANGGKPDVLPAASMLHIPGLGFDGLIGYSVVAMARESIGLGLATERFGGTFFGNGATFGGHLSHPLGLNKDTRQQIRESIEEVHAGVNRAHKFLITGGGMKYERLGIPPEDAQFLETRQFQIEEMCRWFRMPPHKIQHLLQSTNNNIEHQGIEYYTDTLRTWLVRWEQEINRKLIAPTERRIQFAEHQIDGVLRGDISSRYTALGIARDKGIINADEWRELENMNPQPNGQGQLYLVQQAMVPADRLNDVIDAQIAKGAAPPPPPGQDQALTDANARADAAERAAAEARDVAQTERDLRIALEATGTATAEELTRRCATEGAANAVAAQLTGLAGESRARADALQAQADQLAADVSVERTARETAEGRVTTAEREREELRVEVATRTAEREAVQTALTVMTAERDAVQTALETRDTPLVDDARVAMLTAQIASLQGTAADRETALTAARTELAAADARGAAATLARTAAEDAGAAEHAAHLQRMTAVISTHRGLIADAMGRMIRRETEKARRAQSTPEKLLAWIDTFYPIHADICQVALLPAIRVHLAWAQSAEDPVVVTAGFVKSHIDESIRQLRLVLESDAEDVPVTLEATLRHWELDRADALADAILQEEIDYVAHP